MALNDITIDAEAFLRADAVAGRFRRPVLLTRNGEVLLRNGYGLADEE